MKDFTYTYQGKIVHSEVDYFIDRGAHRYRVKVPESDSYCVISPSGFPGAGNMIIRVQSVKPGEIVQPHDLIQAMGEGIEKASFLVSS